MAKHIAAPATVEELVQTLGITREDREIVERVLRELGEYDHDTPEAATTNATTGADANPSSPRDHEDNE